MFESSMYWVLGSGFVLLVAGCIALVYFWPRLLGRRAMNFDQARLSFHRRREWLEARFLTLAAQSGKPRGLRWADCDFDDDVSFARDRKTHRFRALVAVTIQFEAIEGGWNGAR